MDNKKKNKINDDKFFEKNNNKNEGDKKINQHKLKKTDKKKSASDIQKNLLNIYEDENGLPDMSKLERKKGGKLKIFLTALFIILLVLAASAWAGFFIFGGLNKSGEENVKLKIEAPSELSSGENITYLIKYKNEGRAPISKIEVAVNYPEGFIFKEAFPQPLNNGNNSWSLGTLAGGKDGQIKISGQLLGSLDTTKTLNAFFNYHPANFNADFREVASFNTKITSSVVNINLDSDEQIIAGELTKISFKYTNKYKDALPKIKITALLPNDFSLDKTEPEATQENNIWIIKNLEPQEEQKIDLTGSFLSEASGKKEITFKVELEGEKEIWYLQQQKTFPLNVLKGELIANLIINGSDKDQPIDFGKILNYSIVYQNKGQTEIKNLVVKATLSGNLADWGTAVDKNNGIIKDNTISWSEKEIPGLKLLKPNEEGTIDWQIKIKSRGDFKENETIDSSLKSSVEITIGEVGKSGASSSVQSSTITNELNSDLTLSAEGRYFNDDNIALGSGPLPPKVGETTSYHIIWKLNNSVHEISNVKVKTILPKNIFWTGKSVISAGQLNFNVNNREIVWSINRMPTTVRELTANFEISVTPSGDDVNTILTLVPETTLEAIDKVTEDQLFLAAKAITSNLENDPIAAGKGLVIE